MEFDFSREECLNLESALNCEWLETNGLGGYAASTVPGCNTRPEHGLLVAPVESCGGVNHVFLAKFEAAVIVRKQTFHLSTNQFPGVFHPTGHKYVERFRGAQYPMTLYRVGDILLRRSILMIHGQNTVLLRYELLNSDLPITLSLSPLLAFRDARGLTHENPAFNGEWSAAGTACRIKPYETLPALYVDCSMDSDLIPAGRWLKSVEYFNERIRNRPYQEDLYQAGRFELRLHSGSVLVLRASLDLCKTPIMDQWKHELSWRQVQVNQHREEPLPIRVLKANAKHFVLRQPNERIDVRSSYPRGAVRERDTLISAVGLFLGRGKRRDMEDVLLRYVESGKILDLADTDEIPGEMDAPLWFVWSCVKYLECCKNQQFIIKNLLPAILKILAFYADDRISGCRRLDNGLLMVDTQGGPATWMFAPDEGEGGFIRQGLIVEVNALWYHALSTTREFCKSFGIPYAPNFDAILDALDQSFAGTFFVKEGYLVDSIYDGRANLSIRPNQIIAAALTHSPLTDDQRRSIVTTVTTDLLTPFGLRTLTPGDPAYVGQFFGPEAENGRARHLGSAWPWLIGFYVESRLRLSDDVDFERHRLEEYFEPLFMAHVGKACVGSISETFDGDPPHAPQGEFARSLSVSEVIRAWNLLNKGNEFQ